MNTVGGAGYGLDTTSLRFVERAGDYVYVGTDPGSFTLTLGYTAMHRLEPGDTSWAQAAQVGLTSPIAVSVEDVAYDASTGTYYAASAFAGCYVSDDGLTWAERRVGLPEMGNNFTGYFANGYSVVADDGRAFLNVFSTAGDQNGGVYVSDDAGLTWSKSGGVGGTMGTIAQFGDRLLYSTTGPITPDDGVYYTDDGETWERTPFLSLSFDIRVNSTHLFAARDNLLMFSATDGITWDELDDQNLPADFLAYWIEPSETHLFLYGVDNNGPKLYRRTLASLDLTPTTQFVVDPSDSVSSLFVNPGQTLSLSSVAAGPNINYQWQIDGVDINGATSADLDILVTNTTEGDLTVEVEGDDGTIESSSISLTLIPDEPGFQDVSFAQPPLPMQGSQVIYDDYGVLQVEAPRMQLLDQDGQVLVRREPIADSRIRRAFIDSQGGLVGFGEFSLIRLDPETLIEDPSFSTVTFSGTTGTTLTTIRVNDVVELPGQGYLCAVNRNTTLGGDLVPPLVLIDYNGDLVSSFSNPFINSSINFSPEAIQVEVTCQRQDSCIDDNISMGKRGYTSAHGIGSPKQ